MANIIEALQLILECSSSIFNNKDLLQIDGAAHGPHKI